MSQRATMRPWAVVIVLLVAACVAMAMGFVACSSDRRPVPHDGTGTNVACPPCNCGPTKVVDDQLMAFLSKARATHHQADLFEQGGEPKKAIGVLVRLVEGPVPGGQQPSAEVREVMADAYARLAVLRSTASDFNAAIADIDSGLRLAKEPTHFRGRLLEVRGLVEERRAKVLRAEGDEQAANEARDRAIEAFQKAVGVQEKVIATALSDGGT